MTRTHIHMLLGGREREWVRFLMLIGPVRCFLRPRTKLGEPGLSQARGSD